MVAFFIKPRRLSLGLLVLAFILATPMCKLTASTVYWTNSSGGLYSEPSNWSPNGVPAAGDNVLFTNPGPYILTINAGATNAGAFFHQGSVTQAVSGEVWLVTNQWRVGETASSTSRVTAVSGLLVVTNETSSGVLSVGRVGTGELAIRGGDVVADSLLATNDSRSPLTFAHGTLTTLHGITVNNGSSLVVGGVTNGPFIWNITGGTNQILNGGLYGYGGLTLGGARGGIINLSGSNTSLRVYGLNTSGDNRINIRGGAKFRTQSVQLGLGSGESNVVVIADPGSCWTNDYLMFFGMHSGAQTMIISNGGYFRTGGPTYGDQIFNTFDFPDEKIIITGTNSWFHSDGVADFGMSFSSRYSPLNDLLVVTNGGRFWARRLSYGSTDITFGSISRPGVLIDIADGTLWIGSLNFEVGNLRIGAGTGTIDQLNMTGGTNAVLQLLGNLYIGHHGNLAPGDLRVGGTNMSLPVLNGQLQLGGWQMGALAGDSGNVTMGGGAFVTNGSQSASLVVGGGGNGVLRIDSGSVQANLVRIASSPGSSGSLLLNGPASSLATPSLFVGTGGTVTVSNAATLQISRCTGPASAVSVNNATLEFLPGAPDLASGVISTTNATISFRDVNFAQLDLSEPYCLGRIQRSGQTALQLIQATNAPIAALELRADSVSDWSRLVLNGGTSAIQAGSILIEANSSLAATNTFARISGFFTNRGQLTLNNSTLRFADPVTLSLSSVLQGSNGVLLFDGGLHLPATDVIIPSGISVQVRTITSEGGKLVLTGGGIIPNDDGTMPAGIVSVQDGWVTYLDNPAAPFLPPPGLSGPLGLELLRSTNAPVTAPTFTGGTGGYERLRLGAGSSWRSHQLTVGQGGAMFLAAPTATVALTSSVFRVEHGGLFRDDTGGTNHIGFSPTSSNAMAIVSGDGSTWVAPNALSVGAAGFQNQLLVEYGGKLLANTASMGGNTNQVIINGTGASFLATNGLTIGGLQNQFLIQTGGVFSGSQMLFNGSTGLVFLKGTGAVMNCSMQIGLSGTLPTMQIEGGAAVFTSNAVLNAFRGPLVDISGAGSLWRLTGQLTMTNAGYTSRTNRLTIRQMASIITPSVFMQSGAGGGAEIRIESGQLIVTNAAGSANLTVNGRLFLQGGLLRADKLTASDTSNSRINISAGKAEWVASDLAQGIPLRIGDGTNLATLNLLGGTSICRNGLEICRYSRLTGSGTIASTVTNRGTLLPSALAIQGDLVLDSTSESGFSLAGQPGSPQNSSLSITGVVSLAGKLRISIAPGTVLNSSQNFVLIQAGIITSNFSNVAFGQRLLTSDRLASFRIENTGTTVLGTDFRPEDLDGDGIQDAWAMQYFGASPLLPGAGANSLDGDWDGDGLSNRTEFLLGTDPTNFSSCLRVQLELLRQGGINVHFPYLPNCAYSISASDDLQNWTNTAIEEVRFDPAGLAVWNEPAVGKRFYRLWVQPSGN